MREGAGIANISGQGKTMVVTDEVPDHKPDEDAMSKAMLAVGRVIRWSFVGSVPVGCEQLGKPPTSTPRLHARGHLRTGKLDLVDLPDRAAGEVTPGPVRVDIASRDYRAAITVAKC